MSQTKAGETVDQSCDELMRTTHLAWMSKGQKSRAVVRETSRNATKKRREAYFPVPIGDWKKAGGCVVQEVKRSGDTRR